MSTYTYSSTFTSSRIEVVAKQFERGLIQSGLSQKEINKILNAVKEKKISAIGIFALNRNKQRVAEVEISVDWAKHQNQISVYGEHFEYLGAINHKTGEAAEPKVYVNSLIELAKVNKYNISCWIRPSEHASKKDMLELGFRGDVPNWSSDPVKLSNERILALEEMNIQLSAVSNPETGKQKYLSRSDNFNIFLIINIIIAAVLCIALVAFHFNISTSTPLKWIFYFSPFLSCILYLTFLDAENDFMKRPYIDWTKYDTVLLLIILIEGIPSAINYFVYNPILENVCKVLSHVYIIPVLALTTYRGLNIIEADNPSDKRITKHKLLAIFMYWILFIVLIFSLMYQYEEI